MRVGGPPAQKSARRAALVGSCAAPSHHFPPRPPRLAHTANFARRARVVGAFAGQADAGLPQQCDHFGGGGGGTGSNVTSQGNEPVSVPPGGLQESLALPLSVMPV